MYGNINTINNHNTSMYVLASLSDVLLLNTFFLLNLLNYIITYIIATFFVLNDEI